VDLLLVDGLTYRSARVGVPHVSITERRFVLVPLLELDPGLTLPDGTALADSLSGLGEGQEVRRVGPPLVA
jgi:7,8-dihydro-6-hydroxymethylpterin-pyrophosphokinase